MEKKPGNRGVGWKDSKIPVILIFKKQFLKVKITWAWIKPLGKSHENRRNRR
jgi:hypothetical protein